MTTQRDVHAIRWPNKDPIEHQDTTFPYAKELNVGETLSTCVMSVVVRGGVDASPSNILDGAQQIAGTDVLQRVKSGLDGVNYAIRCDATTSTGRVLTRAAILPVRLIV